MDTDGAVRSRLRWPALAGLVVWTLVILRATLWPLPPQQPLGATLRQLLDALRDAGIPREVSYDPVEMAANVAMFVPLGICTALVLPRRWGWVAAAYGLLLSTAVELGQRAWFPARYPSVRDVVMNTTGAVIGWLLVAWWRRRSQ